MMACFPFGETGADPAPNPFPTANGAPANAPTHVGDRVNDYPAHQTYPGHGAQGPVHPGVAVVNLPAINAPNAAPAQMQPFLALPGRPPLPVGGHQAVAPQRRRGRGRRNAPPMPPPVLAPGIGRGRGGGGRVRGRGGGGRGGGGGHQAAINNARGINDVRIWREPDPEVYWNGITR